METRKLERVNNENLKGYVVVHEFGDGAYTICYYKDCEELVNNLKPYTCKSIIFNLRHIELLQDDGSNRLFITNNHTAIISRFFPSSEYDVKYAIRIDR